MNLRDAGQIPGQGGNFNQSLTFGSQPLINERVIKFESIGHDLFSFSMTYTNEDGRPEYIGLELTGIEYLDLFSWLEPEEATVEQIWNRLLQMGLLDEVYEDINFIGGHVSFSHYKLGDVVGVNIIMVLESKEDSMDTNEVRLRRASYGQYKVIQRNVTSSSTKDEVMNLLREFHLVIES